MGDVSAEPAGEGRNNISGRGNSRKWRMLGGFVEGPGESRWAGEGVWWAKSGEAGGAATLALGSGSWSSVL